MQTIDIGINLTHRQFQSDREEVLPKAIGAGVSPLIITGTSVRASGEAANYAAKHPGVLYSTAGVHPHDAKSCNAQTIGQLRALLGQPQVVAVGECGLDYDRDFSPRDVQRKWFEAQIALAEELGMPLFLHERAAFADFHSLLSQHPEICSRAVVHCFTGSKRELEAYLEIGCSIGITGWVCDERRGEQLRAIVKYIPREKLMIETDAPFLIPRNLKPRPQSNRNEPAYLPHIAAEIAKCRGEAAEELAAYTT
ncbi:MAG: TatD family hydrolase [Oscillospiraceae bacterium]